MHYYQLHFRVLPADRIPPLTCAARGFPVSARNSIARSRTLFLPPEEG
jgi:hypothetical protein